MLTQVICAALSIAVQHSGSLAESEGVAVVRPVAEEQNSQCQQTVGCEHHGIHARVMLSDGSSINGVCQTEDLELETIFDPDLRLPMPLVSEVLSVDDGRMRLRLANDDILTGRMKTASLSVGSLLGRLTIPFERVRQVRFTSSAGEVGALIYYSTFDDPEAILDPVVGPKGVPGNATFVPGRVGNAARVPRLGNAGVVNLPKGFLGTKGCIEFWAKIESNKDYFASCDPRLFCIRYAGGSDVVLEYSDNNGAGKGGLNIRLPGLGIVSSHQCGGHFYSEILEDQVCQWHHYAMSWNETKCTFYLDGRPYRMAYAYPGHLEESIVKGQSSELGFPNVRNADGTHPRSAYLIDEFKIWNCEKSQFDL